MSMVHDYSSRQLVPRLLSSETANALSLNLNTADKIYSQMNSFELHNYQKLKAEWRIDKNNIIATQILMYEIINDSLSVDQEIINYLNSNQKYLNQIENEILFIAKNKAENNEILIQQPQYDVKIPDLIKEIRSKNLINPRNSLQWCNLGYFYTRLGLIDKAEKAFKIAIELNNSNRYIVRSVARFFLHIGKKEYGHNILVMSPRINYDPNLISAEIAFSELLGKKSKFVDKGMKLKDDKNISIFEKNELLAQIATLEFSYGKNSKGKTLLNECLISPNENSLAQIAFLEKKCLLELLPDIPSSVICQFEALTRINFGNSDFQKSFENAKEWHKFQPFSNNPAIFASYIASTIFNNYKEAIEILRSVVKITPNSFLLNNNLAFYYAKNNNIENAVSTLKRINTSELDEHNNAVLNATAGFISYKLGNIDSAKIGYDEAIKYFRMKKDEISLAIALYNYSNILDKCESDKILNEVSELSKKNNIVELNYLLRNREVSIIEKST